MKVDLNKLTDEQREKVERALKPRNRTLSLNFNSEDIARWKKEADRDNESLSDRIERRMNASEK